MRIVFSDQASEDYLHWQATDRKQRDRFNTLIRECRHTPFADIGKAEPSRGPLAGWWSRRIDREQRLVYRVADDTLQTAPCRCHY